MPKSNPPNQSAGFAPARSSSIRVRQKYSAARNANSPKISSVPVRSLTFALKTRIGSSDSVVQAKTPSTAYAIRASTNFFLIVNFYRLSVVSSRSIAASFVTLVHRGGFEPPYLLRGTDLQSVGFNHSPTCANPKTPPGRAKKQHRHCPAFLSSGNESRELPPDNYTRRIIFRWSALSCAASARRRANLFCFRNLVFLELAKGIEPPTL